LNLATLISPSIKTWFQDKCRCAITLTRKTKHIIKPNLTKLKEPKGEPNIAYGPVWIQALLRASQPENKLFFCEKKKLSTALLSLREAL